MQSFTVIDPLSKDPNCFVQNKDLENLLSGILWEARDGIGVQHEEDEEEAEEEEEEERQEVDNVDEV